VTLVSRVHFSAPPARGIRAAALLFFVCPQHKEITVKKLIPIVTLALASITCGERANAQPMAPPNDPHIISDQDIALMRQDIRSHKKQLVAQSLTLTDAEATRFWPIYDRYVAELIKINDKKFALIQQYADQYATISDDQALTFAKQWTDMDTQVSQLRQKYIPIVAQALNGKLAATFAQIDRRMTMMIDLQLSTKMPLVQGAK
jgi:hypothetical protein